MSSRLYNLSTQILSIPINSRRSTYNWRLLHSLMFLPGHYLLSVCDRYHMHTMVGMVKHNYNMLVDYIGGTKVLNNTS